MEKIKTMKHEYKYKFAVLIILFSLNLYAGENEDLYNRSLAKWNKSRIKEYFIKINFTAFSPMAGIWELKVKDGNIYLCTFNGKTADSNNKSAEMFTMENIYKMAGEGITAGKNDPFIIKITCDKKGLIKSLAKIRNPEFKNKVKTDTSFKIEVLDFIPAGK